MEYKILLAQELREGLRQLRGIYAMAFRTTTPFRAQWDCLILKEAYDLDWHEHKVIVETDFAWKSKRLLSHIQGD